MEGQKTTLSGTTLALDSTAGVPSSQAEGIADCERDYRIISPCMFLLSGLFTVLLAILIVVWVDVPRVAELQSFEQNVVGQPHESAPTSSFAKAFPYAYAVGEAVRILLFVIWPVFWVEYLLSGVRTIKRGGKWPWSGLLGCAIPPLRMAAPNAALGGRIWLPLMHWQTPGRHLSRRLEHNFSKPMLFIGLSILPILLVEYGLHSVVGKTPWLQSSLHAATGFIWCAFTLEFIIMFNATDRKLRYINTHRIDLMIILLPLVSFLRSLQVLRLTNIAHVQKLAKMGRVFRMRGLMMRTVRALMLLEVVNRLFRFSPEKKLAGLKTDLEEKQEEIELLKQEITQLEHRIGARQPFAESVLQVS